MSQAIFVIPHHDPVSLQKKTVPLRIEFDYEDRTVFSLQWEFSRGLNASMQSKCVVALGLYDGK